MRSARFGFRESPLQKEEHRASVMPDHLQSIDPFFLDGVFRMFTPEQEKMVEEKIVDRARKAGAV